MSCDELLVCRSPYGIAPHGATTPVTPDATGGSAMVQDGEPGSDDANHIILMTIFNPLYPITVVSGPDHVMSLEHNYSIFSVFQQDVMRTICSPYGFVQRIVIFRKNGLQVLVEYPFTAIAPIQCLAGLLSE